MISEKYKDLYISTSREQLKKLSDLFLYLEKKPNSENLIENIFRLIHSMKGAAATMAYKQTVIMFHAIESIIDAAYNNALEINKKTIDSFFSTLKVIEANINSIAKTNKEIDLKKPIELLNGLLKSKLKPSKNAGDIKRVKHVLGNLPSVAEISVSTDKLDKLQNYLDDLLINIMQARALVEKSNQTELLSNCINSDKMLSDLRRELEKIRIVPLKQIFSSLPYLVREVAREENKSVDLIIEDNDLSLDKAILDELVDILIQLLKNAVAHGIKLGQKNGQIHLETILNNDQMRVIVEDNGQGIDAETVLSLAVKNKIVSPSASKKLTISEIRNLIFMPGISKGQNLSTSSGRGVGLSLVKSRVGELEGQIKVLSDKGKGTKFIIDFPLPLSVFRALVFKIRDYHFAIPLSYIEQIVKLEKLKDFSNSKTFRYKQKTYQLLNLDKILAKQNLAELYKYLVIISDKKRNLALPIFSNINESELVMKKTPSILKKSKYFKGVAISSKGQPVLVLDINNLV
ncbi:MAG: ATP-binding protein [bacterium]|nr:ATP-binding protein [bacterium]